MTTPRVLVSIDPGIDRAAAALWLTEDTTSRFGTGADVATLAVQLKAIRECHTEPDVAMAARLAQLTSWASLLVEDVRRLLLLSNLVAVGDRAEVVVEWPAFAGMFRGRTRQRSKLVQPNAEAMGKLYAATGAIIGGCSRWCPLVTAAPASKTPRETKQLVGRTAIERASGIPNNGRFVNNDDARSAVFIGIQTLSVRA